LTAAGWRLLFDRRTKNGWLKITGKPFPANSWTKWPVSLQNHSSETWFRNIKVRVE